MQKKREKKLESFDALTISSRGHILTALGTLPTSGEVSGWDGKNEKRFVPMH